MWQHTRLDGTADLRKTYGSHLPQSCEVLIQVMASSVNPSDRYPSIASHYLPHVLGSDVAGTVVDVGADCTHLKASATSKCVICFLFSQHVCIMCASCVQLTLTRWQWKHGIFLR